MTDFAHIIIVWLGTVGVTFLVWFVVRFNGRTICGLCQAIALFFRQKQTNNIAPLNWQSTATEIELISLGLVPLAIASLVSTARGNCYSSINSFLFTEAIFVGLFSLTIISKENRIIPPSQPFFSPLLSNKNWIIIAIAIVWCLVFAVWAESAINPQDYLGAERLVINKNADMWYYVRRYAAYTLKNLSFDNQPACYYLQLSPKKLSSFIGSIIVYLTPNTVVGITLFQGLLGCSLFLSLFGNWYSYSYADKRLSNWGAVGAVIWGIFSPPIFWLLNSSYLSNTLFITIFVLSLTAARRISLNPESYPAYAKYVILFSFIINIFSFYLVILPLALLCYLVTVIIYSPVRYLDIKSNLINFSKIILAAGIAILGCAILFNHQINLNEVANNLNTLKQHGQNFVPLNPWSLIQEKPNPMPPNTKDFGVWFNIAIGIIFSTAVLRQISLYWQTAKARKRNKFSYGRDLTSAILVIGLYLLYLLAYIPLEYTYRLGKLAISIIYPLAILGILPTIFWMRDRFYHQKSRLAKLICLALVGLHIVLHVDKSMSPRALPLGKYTITSVSQNKNISDLTLVGCRQTSISQRYERLVGLDVAKKYPSKKINVVAKLDEQSAATDLIFSGIDVSHQDENLCLFELAF
ncbi:MAG: hypothetical protein AAFY50_22715 [Cyanobacteria bacterium J06648_1]